jgi:transcriptional regulator with XRE-family HTH domain
MYFMNAQAIISELVNRGLTQQEIQRRSGVHQSTVSALLTGRRGKNTSYDIVTKLQKLLEEVIAEQSKSIDDAQNNPGGSSERKLKQARERSAI